LLGASSRKTKKARKFVTRSALYSTNAQGFTEATNAPTCYALSRGMQAKNMCPPRGSGQAFPDCKYLPIEYKDVACAVRVAPR
jgi:hypothetical protein